MTKTIGNPLSWSAKEIGVVGQHLGSVAGHIGHGDAPELEMPAIRRISVGDLRDVLREGAEDFGACRTDVAFLCLLYPVIGITLAWLALDRELLPLVFPVMSGFALIGPVAAVGLYEMSRRRERTGWAHAFGVARSPSFGAIFVLAALLFAIFFVWLIAAHGIWSATLGPETPASIGAFLADVFTTLAGWTMIVVGLAVGAVFATIVLAISVVSFPLLLEHPVGVPTAIVTSIRAVALNPRPMLVWGVIVGLSLAIGTIPVFLGLIVVLPVLGHSTWHLYRRVVGGPEQG
jgi:uncharacterized membrane protein